MATHSVTIETPLGTRQTISVGDDEHILDVALGAGIDLPHSCLQGWCLTCAATLVHGRVNQEDSRRYYEADREAGFVLLCTGRPESNLSLRSHARDAMRRARDARGLPYPRGEWGSGGARGGTGGQGPQARGQGSGVGGQGSERERQKSGGRR